VSQWTWEDDSSRSVVVVWARENEGHSLIEDIRPGLWLEHSLTKPPPSSLEPKELGREMNDTLAQ